MNHCTRPGRSGRPQPRALRRGPAGRPALTLLLALCVCGPASAADPMRPLPVPGKAPAAASAPTTAAAAAPVPAALRPLGRLIAIRQDSQGRQQALIGERWVSVGDTLDQATVVAIAPNQVDLRVGKTRSTIHLLPPLQAGGEAAADRAVLAQQDRVPHAHAARGPGSTTR